MTDEALSPAVVALKTVRKRLDEALVAAERSSGDAALVAVSKNFDSEAIVPVLDAGQRVFGENRVQEAMAKWPALKERFAGVELHLIGPLQSNKAAEAVRLFDVIETLDRPKLAQALVQEREKGAVLPPLFVQVNTGDETQKAGVSVSGLPEFLALCRDEYGLSIAGLMCIPPVDDHPAPHFALLERLAKRHGLHQISMGMSADYESAVAFGATHVRVGSAIFGHR